MYAWVRMLLDSPIFSARPEAITRRWATSKSLYLIEELPELITRMIMMSPPYPLTQAHRPAMCMGRLPAWRVSWALLQRTWLCLPDVAGVFRNGAVTRKLAGMAHIEDRLA